MTITIPTSGEMVDEAAERYEAGRIAAIKYYVETGIKDLETNLGLGEDRGKIFPHPDYITLDKVWKDIRDVLKEGGYEVLTHDGSWGYWNSDFTEVIGDFRTSEAAIADRNKYLNFSVEQSIGEPEFLPDELRNLVSRCVA